MLGGEQAAPEKFCADVAALVGAKHVTLCVLRHKQLKLVPAFSTHPERLNAEWSLTGKLSAEKLEEIIDNHGATTVDVLGGSRLLHPVFSAGDAIGLIDAEAVEGLSFSADDVSLISNLAPFAEKSLQQELVTLSRSPSPGRPPSPPRSTAGSLAAQNLLQMVSGLARISSADVLIRQIRSAAKEAVGADMCTVFLVSDDRKQLIGRKSEAEGGEMFGCPINSGLAGYVVQTGQQLNLSDAHSDERFNAEMDRKTGYRTRQVLSLPIFSAAGMVAGVCQCMNKRGGGNFSREDGTS